MEKYQSKLSVLETQKAIRALRHRFEENLCDGLNLSRASAPLFVKKGSGLNDDLNGFERHSLNTVLKCTPVFIPI